MAYHKVVASELYRRLTIAVEIKTGKSFIPEKILGQREE